MTDWLSLTTEEFSRARIAVLPVAAVEQHGPHLPVGTDTYIAEAYLARVRALLPEDLPVVLLPVQQVGASDEHRAFAGTLTLSPETALRAFIEIGESVHRAGIAKLVIINSHGGNIALIDLAARQLRVRHNMLAVHASWGRFGYPEGLFTEAEQAMDLRTRCLEVGRLWLAVGAAPAPHGVRRRHRSAAPDDDRQASAHRSSGEQCRGRWRCRNHDKGTVIETAHRVRCVGYGEHAHARGHDRCSGRGCVVAGREHIDNVPGLQQARGARVRDAQRRRDQTRAHRAEQ